MNEQKRKEITDAMATAVAELGSLDASIEIKAAIDAAIRAWKTGSRQTAIDGATLPWMRILIQNSIDLLDEARANTTEEVGK